MPTPNNTVRRALLLLVMSVTMLEVGCASSGSADAGRVKVADIPRPRITVPYASTPPRVDGHPDDAAWDRAATIDQLAPCVGGDFTSSPATSVKLLWDADCFYIRFICVEHQLFVPHGDTRDAMHHEGDVVELFMDPIGDGKQYFEVQVNPAGGVLDLVHFVTTDAPPTDDLTLPQDQWGTDHWCDFAWTMPGLRTAAWTEPMAGGGTRWITDIAIPAEVVLRRSGIEQFEPMQLRANFLRLDGPADLATGERKPFIGLNWAPTCLGLPHLSPAAMGYVALVRQPAAAEP